MVQDNKITFMNQLSNTILTSLTGMRNFWMKEHADGSNKDNKTDRFNEKLFFLIENQDFDK